MGLLSTYKFLRLRPSESLTSSKAAFALACIKMLEASVMGNKSSSKCICCDWKLDKTKKSDRILMSVMSSRPCSSSNDCESCLVQNVLEQLNNLKQVIDSIDRRSDLSDTSVAFSVSRAKQMVP